MRPGDEGHARVEGMRPGRQAPRAEALGDMPAVDHPLGKVLVAAQRIKAQQGLAGNEIRQSRQKSQRDQQRGPEQIGAPEAGRRKLVRPAGRGLGRTGAYGRLRGLAHRYRFLVRPKTRSMIMSARLKSGPRSKQARTPSSPRRPTTSLSPSRQSRKSTPSVSHVFMAFL